MIETAFREIAIQNNYEYQVQNLTFSGTLGSKLPVSIHTLSLDHKGILIRIIYEFGNHNIAEIKFEINTKKSIPEFKLQTKDHFSRLFSFKKDAWKVKSENTFMTSKLIDILRLTGLTKIANEESFEPTITGINENGKYLFKTIFYLGFENKEQSIAPIIEFHKQIINFIGDKYVH